MPNSQLPIRDNFKRRIPILFPDGSSGGATAYQHHQQHPRLASSSRPASIPPFLRPIEEEFHTEDDPNRARRSRTGSTDDGAIFGSRVLSSRAGVADETGSHFDASHVHPNHNQLPSQLLQRLADDGCNSDLIKSG